MCYQWRDVTEMDPFEGGMRVYGGDEKLVDNEIVDSEVQRKEGR